MLGNVKKMLEDNPIISCRGSTVFLKSVESCSDRKSFFHYIRVLIGDKYVAFKTEEYVPLNIIRIYRKRIIKAYEGHRRVKYEEDGR